MSGETSAPLRLSYLMHTDVVAAARVLLRHPRQRWAWVLHRMLAEAVKDGRYIEATRSVLQRHGGLWFNDESYVISRRRSRTTTWLPCTHW